MAYQVGDYDIVVIGAGHAGCEAALAGARMGCRTLVLTTNLENIALMACNPSVGGPAKAHLVCEVDALGGEMARNVDETHIQMRMLNTGKGPAVQALRAQVDRRQYQGRMRRRLELHPRIDLKQAMVKEIVVEGGMVRGIVTRTGLGYGARAVVVATGTYLEGRVITGDYSHQAGPSGQLPAEGLSDCLRRLGLDLVRFKTGTPPRVDGGTVDYRKMVPQPGDEEPWTLSFISTRERREQLPCWLTNTNERTHELIRRNLHRAPLFSGDITGVGPRYCPSIEDKIVRFPDKLSHQVFLEPEGRDTSEMYVLGLSTSLPEDVQVEVLRSIPGLEEAEMMRAGYAIEYDCLVPAQLKRSLQVKGIAGLFSAGQINGTSGYEEAAAQGVLAGINAALFVQGREPLILGRSESYIGVLVDDLTTKGSREPYRMLTSRAEFRLLLRQDNADLRLTEKGRAVGLVDDERYRIFSEKREAIARERERVRETLVYPGPRVDEVMKAAGSASLRSPVSAESLLRRPEIGYRELGEMGYGDGAVAMEVQEQVEVEIQYEGYIAKQRDQVARIERLESRAIPAELEYEAIRGLSTEARQKLGAMGPETVGQASRISGVSPADISVLLVYLERYRGIGSAGK
jgi:tRNA uridine 5-carboxymethylaminomethyl modification enzyme